MVSPLNPRKYMGPDVYLANVVSRPRRPTGADFKQPETGRLYPVFAGWQVGKDPTTGTEGELWMLTKIVANVAYWEMITSSGPAPDIITLTGDDGVAVPADALGNIDTPSSVVANGSIPAPIYAENLGLNNLTTQIQLTTTVTPTPVSSDNVGLACFNENQFTVDPDSGMVSLAGSSPTTGAVMTITGDDGVPVEPDIDGNIDLLGQVVANGTNPTPVYFESPVASTEVLDIQIANAVSPTPGTPANVGLCCFNDTQFTVDPTSGMVSAIGSTGTDYHAARYIVSAGGAADGANYTTIASAIAQAIIDGGSQTIVIQPGTYVENLTLPANINLSGFGSDAQTPAIQITGTITCTDAGWRTIYGVQLNTNGAASLSVTGSAATNVNLVNCYLNATNASSIIGSSSGNGTITLIDCYGGISGSNSTFTLTNGTNITFFNSKISGTTTTSSAGSGCDVALVNSTILHPINTTGTATFGMRNSQVSSTATSVTCNSTGGHNFHGSMIGGAGSVAAITVASGCTVSLFQCEITGNTADVITGAGTVRFGDLLFGGNGNNITVTTQSLFIGSNTAKKVTIPGAYPYTVKAQDYFIPVDTSSARTINLPAAPQDGEEHNIKDNTGSAAANNITVQGNGNNIDGSASRAINTNRGSFSFIYNGTQWNVF